MIKIPKYIEKELEKASSYASKVGTCVGKFEEWVRKNVDEDFDFDILRAGIDDISRSTEALTEIEYGNDVNTMELERVINIWIKENK